MRTSYLRMVAFGFLLSCVITQGQTQPVQTNSSTTKSTNEPSSQAVQPGTLEGTDEAKALLHKVETAYDTIDRLETKGAVSVDINMTGEQQKTEQSFTSSFQAPNKFKHESKDGLKVGSTGEKAYLFNEKEKSYLWLDAPSENASMQDLPRIIPQILQAQNPSLLFALSKNGVKDVAEGFGKVEKTADVKLGAKSYPGLKLSSSENEGSVQMLIDPGNHLVRQFTFDFKPSLEKSGATNVKSARIIIDYATVSTNPAFATNFFAWNPPQGALDVHEAAGAQRPATAERLVGKTAPEFTLQALDGKPVSLKQLKGKVVVLDFWATWCPPCREALPHLASINQEMKKQDVQVFAVNMEEDKEKVKTFLELKKIDVPVLLDAEGTVAKQYNVSSIPQTVIIGKDGKVKKSFVGYKDGMEEEIRQAILSAQKQK